MMNYCPLFFFFFFNDTATTEIYTLSLHDALPTSRRATGCCTRQSRWTPGLPRPGDRKSTRLNSSHVESSYAVFCLKKKKNHDYHTVHTYKKINRQKLIIA